MFFILNSDKAVLAADKAFLDSIDAPNIYALAELFHSGNVQLDEEAHRYQIGESARTFSRSSLSTTVGDAYLYMVEEEVASAGLPISAPVNEPAQPEEPLAAQPIDDTPVDQLPAQTETETDTHEEDELFELLDASEPKEGTVPLETESDDLPEIVDSPEESNQESDTIDAAIPLAGVAAGAGVALSSSESSSSKKEDELLDLINQSSPDDTHGIAASTNLPPLEHDEQTSLHKSLFADYQHNAEIIGITHDEYLGFLGQFADEALESEEGIRSQDLYVSRQSVTSLKDASQLLHLPRITEKLNELIESSSSEKSDLSDQFFEMIRHIRHDIKEPQEDRPAQHPSVAPILTDEPHEQPPVEAVAQKTEDATLPLEEVKPQEGVETFETIEPIPFEFSSKIASDELGLPESLVQEFVSDFITQSKENVSVFRQAQSAGDIETIQKTAHLLKGAASNLRIDPLAKTLESLQLNEEIEKVPALFKVFLGQLKALSNFTKQSNY